MLRPNHWNVHINLDSKQVLFSSHDLKKSVVNQMLNDRKNV